MGRGKHGGQRAGAGRPSSGRDDTTVKMDRAVVARAKFVASARGISLAEYLSETVRTTVDRDFAKEAERLAGGGPR